MDKPDLHKVGSVTRSSIGGKAKCVATRFGSSVYEEFKWLCEGRSYGLMRNTAGTECGTGQVRSRTSRRRERRHDNGRRPLTRTWLSSPPVARRYAWDVYARSFE
jgi:hypothetical protein